MRLDRCLALTALVWPIATWAAEVPDQLGTSAITASRAAEASLLDIVATTDGAVAVGERGVILALGAEGWKQEAVPVSATLTAVDFNAEGVGLAVGHDGVILRQASPGAPWQKITDGTELFPLVIAAAKDRQTAAAEALAEADESEREDLEFELEDAEFRFETAEQSLAYGPAWPLLDVLFTDPATAWAAGAYGILFRSGDAGETWELVADRLDNFEDLHLNALHQSGAGSLVIAGEGGMLFRSADAGASFERFDTNDALSLFGLAEADGRLYAYGFGNSFQVSEDDGITWASQRLPDNLLLIGDVALPLGGVGLLGGSGLMIPVGPEGAATPTRPTGTRDFLSGAVPGPEGLIFASEAGLLVADPGQGN